jgi:hypothetical protein
MAKLDGIDITNNVSILSESEKTVFLFEFEIPIESKTELKVDYRSNYSIVDDSYNFLYQTQPGSLDTNFVWNLHLSDMASITDYSPSQLRFINQEQVRFIKDDIKQDQEFNLDLR